MRNDQKIPKEDLDLINKSFQKDQAQAILKDAGGNVVGAKRLEVNEKSYVIEDFRGRTLKHGKSLVPKEGPQITIARAGQKYDDIPLNDRNLVVWFESDFV